MASPVIIDDGGSTRVKWWLDPPSVGDLNKLLDVDDTLNPPQSSDKANGPYNHLTIVTLSKAGVSTTVFDGALANNDTFTITSKNSQTVNVKIDATGDCVVTLLGTTTAAPLVEAKQFEKKRRYVVSNAGPIKTITGTANGTAVNFTAAKAVVYTTIFITG